MDPIFRIADLEFEVTHACLRARLSAEGMKWSLKVVSRYPLGRIGDEEWAPVLLWENIAAFRVGFVQRWTDLLSQRVSWRDCYNKSDGSYNATLAVFSHNDVYDCNVMFKKIDAAHCRMRLIGKCDVHFDERYDKKLELEIESDLVFEGIEVEGRDEAAARREVMQFIGSGDFDYVHSGTDSNGPMLRPVVEKG